MEAQPWHLGGQQRCATLTGVAICSPIDPWRSSSGAHGLKPGWLDFPPSNMELSSWCQHDVKGIHMVDMWWAAGAILTLLALVPPRPNGPEKTRVRFWTGAFSALLVSLVASECQVSPSLLAATVPARFAGGRQRLLARQVAFASNKPTGTTRRSKMTAVRPAPGRHNMWRPPEYSRVPWPCPAKRVHYPPLHTKS